MMWLFGEDFFKARTQWLYPAEPMQGLFRAIVLTVLIFIFYQVFLELFFAAVINAALFDGSAETMKRAYEDLRGTGQADNVVLVNLYKSALIGSFPASAIATLLTVAASHYGLPKMKGTLPLQWPKLGPLGWLTIVAGFWLLTSVFAAGVFTGFGVDSNSNSGAVENALKSLSTDKGLYILAFPGVALGAPLIEEVLFRGVLFAGLMPRVGKVWTVVITSALWAAAHLGAAPLVFAGVIFLMGLMLGVLMLRFGSLWVPIACHTLWNAIVTLQLFHMSGSP